MNNIVEGMNVLEQNAIKCNSSISTITFVIGIIFIILSFIIFCVKTRDIGFYGYIESDDKRLKGLIKGCGIGLIIIIISLFPFPWNKTETGRYTYRCTLEDNVSANYIYDNFNVTNVTEDGIWCIEDR